MPDPSPAVEAAVEGELRLPDPEIRHSPELVGALLHPEFHESGASGRHWDRASIIAGLAAAAEPDTRLIGRRRSVAGRGWMNCGQGGVPSPYGGERVLQQMQDLGDFDRRYDGLADPVPVPDDAPAFERALASSVRYPRQTVVGPGH